MSLKICAISDLHGDLINNIEPCELVCICGDISPLNIQSNYYEMTQWLKNIFKPWCESLPCDKVIFIGGNHDKSFKDIDFMYTNFPKNEKATYLFHENYIYTSKNGKEFSIFGTPYCKVFGHWSFMEPNDRLEELYSQIPENLDILLTHDQPYNYGDVLLDNVYWADGSHIGNEELTKIILDKNPRVQINGHLHSCAKGLIMIGNTQHYNVSIKNESYKIVYNPTIINI